MAHTNYKETGEAILSTDQLYRVVDELLHKNLIERNEEDKKELKELEKEIKKLQKVF